MIFQQSNGKRNEGQAQSLWRLALHSCWVASNIKVPTLHESAIQDADCKPIVTKSAVVSPVTEHISVLCYSWWGKKANHTLGTTL